MATCLKQGPERHTQDRVTREQVRTPARGHVTPHGRRHREEAQEGGPGPGPSDSGHQICLFAEPLTEEPLGTKTKLASRSEGDMRN